MTEEATAEVTEEVVSEETTEQTTEETTIAEKPEWCDDRFYNAETGEVRLEDLHKSWKHANDKISGKKSSPEAYELNFSEDIPKEMLEGLDNESEFIQELMSIAKESDMSQEGFEKLLNLQAKDELEQVEAMKAEREAEMSSLGKHSARRVKDVTLWLDAQLPEAQADALKAVINTAGAVEALEGLILGTRNAKVPMEELPSDVVSIHDDLRKRQFAKDEHGNRLMQNPEYAAKWRNDAAAAGFKG